MEGTEVAVNDKADRAKQFAPFDALKGFREALRERERITADKIELSDETKEELDFKLHQIKPGMLITVIYFNNGEYEKVTGMVSKLSETSRTLSIVNKKMSFDDIYDIQGDSVLSDLMT